MSGRDYSGRARPLDMRWYRVYFLDERGEEFHRRAFAYSNCAAAVLAALEDRDRGGGGITFLRTEEET